MVYIWLVLSKLGFAAAHMGAEQDVFKVGFHTREIVGTLVDEIYGFNVPFSIFKILKASFFFCVQLIWATLAVYFESSLCK